MTGRIGGKANRIDRMRSKRDPLLRQPAPREVVAIVGANSYRDVHVAIHPGEEYTSQRGAPPRATIEQRRVTAEQNRQAAFKVPESLEMRLRIPRVDEQCIGPPSLNFSHERRGIEAAKMIDSGVLRHVGHELVR